MSVLSHALENYESALNLVEFFLKVNYFIKLVLALAPASTQASFAGKYVICKQNCELLTNP